MDRSSKARGSTVGLEGLGVSAGSLGLSLNRAPSPPGPSPDHMGWSHAWVRRQPAGNNEDKAEPCCPTTTLRGQGTKDEWLQKAHSSGLTSASERSLGLEQGCSLTDKEVESQESRIPSHMAPHLCMSHRHFERVNSHKKPWRAPQGCEEPAPRWEAPVHPSPCERLGRAPLWKPHRTEAPLPWGCMAQSKGSPSVALAQQHQHSLGTPSEPSQTCRNPRPDTSNLGVHKPSKQLWCKLI